MINSHSFREQQLLTEFATFRTTPLPGVYLSLAPNNPWLWYGVIFLRSPADGVYTSIPLKFSITWPRNFPDAPPFPVFFGAPGHPLITKSPGSGGAGGSGSGGGGGVGMSTPVKGGGGVGGKPMAGYASMHPGAVNLRDGFPEWFSPKPSAGGNTLSQSASRSSKSNSISAGPSPVEVIYYIRSIFTDRYLEKLQEKLEENEDLAGGIIMDDESWRLWKTDREGLKRRVGVWREDEGVFGEWERGPGADVPIRFLDLQREALDTIKENLGRRVGSEEGA
ncbi:hypothetical protein ABW19_dt0209327 [Dactylella cylindrospora]|nr:hypothetical protein ABW19_dt0209327 [Dactylella cylindrospora]